MVASMKAIALFRLGVSSLAVGALLPFGMVLCGCGDVEGTNTATATCTLTPSSSFSVEQDPPAEDIAVTTTNIVDGSTNTTTTISEAPSITFLTVSATSAGGNSWTVQAGDNEGHSYSGTSTGPNLFEPGADNAYPAGTTIATFSLQCSGLYGEISAVALATIPMEVVRTSTTNGTDVVVGRHGQHTLTPANAEYRLSATAVAGTNTYTLSGRAPIAPATIEW